MSKFKVGQWVVGINKDLDNYNKVNQIICVEDMTVKLDNEKWYHENFLELFSKEEEEKDEPNIHLLRHLHNDLGTLKWIGADEGWDLAIEKVREYLSIELNNRLKQEYRPSPDKVTPCEMAKLEQFNIDERCDIKETKSSCEEPSCPISEQEKFSNDVYKILSNIEKMLIEKNKKYGNSALEPIRVFSKSDNIEQIKVRIDDKLSRIRNNNINDDEDVIDDLIGYLIILKIANENN